MFTVLKEKDTINLIYQNKPLPISILECKPNNIVLMDEIEELEIDIEPMNDRKESKVRKGVLFSINSSLNKKDSKPDSQPANEFVSFSGDSHKLGGN